MPRRKGERPLDFRKCRVVMFVVETGLLTTFTAVQFGAEPGTIHTRHIHRSATSLRLTQGSSSIWRSR
jgi:hypothetical protein